MATELSFQTLLSIIDKAIQRTNPATERESCVGQTEKQRRCTRMVSCSSYIEATYLIRQLPPLVDDPRRLSEVLLELAEFTLCRRDHQTQAEVTVQKWLRTIRSEVDRQRSLPAHTLSNGEVNVVQSDASSGEEIDALSEPDSDAESLWQSDWESDAGDDATGDVGSDDGSLWQSDWDSDAEGDLEDGTEDDESSNTSSNESEDDICPICHETLTDPVETLCEHRFCRGCLSEWLQHNNTCPCDRRPLEVEQFVTLVPDCGICFEECDAACETPCGHTFCRGCITRWISVRQQCPMDRTPLRAIDLVDLHQ